MFEDFFINVNTTNVDTISEVLWEIEAYFGLLQPFAEHYGIFTPNEQY